MLSACSAQQPCKKCVVFSPKTWPKTKLLQQHLKQHSHQQLPYCHRHYEKRKKHCHQH